MHRTLQATPALRTTVAVMLAAWGAWQFRSSGTLGIGRGRLVLPPLGVVLALAVLLPSRPRVRRELESLETTAQDDERQRGPQWRATMMVQGIQRVPASPLGGCMRPKQFRWS